MNKLFSSDIYHLQPADGIAGSFSHAVHANAEIEPSPVLLLPCLLCSCTLDHESTRERSFQADIFCYPCVEHIGEAPCLPHMQSIPMLCLCIPRHNSHCYWCGGMHYGKQGRNNMPHVSAAHFTTQL